MLIDFPTPKKDESIHIRMELTFDVPVEIAEQLEMWGLHQSESCVYDEGRRQMKVTAGSTFYRKGA